MKSHHKSTAAASKAVALALAALSMSPMVVLSGCAGSPAADSLKMSSTGRLAKRNNSSIMGLQLGESRATAVATLGPPDKREAYQSQTGEIEFLFYRTKAWDGQGAVASDDQFTPVAFRAGKLVGWGRNFYEQTIKIAVTVQ